MNQALMVDIKCIIITVPVRKLLQKPDLKTMVGYTTKIKRDLLAHDRLNEHCVNLYGKSLNIIDIHYM